MLTERKSLEEDARLVELLGEDPGGAPHLVPVQVPARQVPATVHGSV